MMTLFGFFSKGVLSPKLKHSNKPLSLLKLTQGYPPMPRLMSSKISEDCSEKRAVIPPLPLGYDNFRDVIDQRLTYVDKSLLIKDFLNDCETQVGLIIRPRRFGKTLNLSMVHHFFAPHVHGKSTKGLFDHLKIAKEAPEYL